MGTRMALGVKQLAVLAAVLGLAACGNELRNDAIGVATTSIADRFSREENQQMTATRASLEASGFNQPLLVGQTKKPGELRAGLLLGGENNGVQFWRGGDGSTVKTDQGIVRGTVGIGYDLYSSETAPVLAALERGDGATYARVYRHLNPLNDLDETRFFCTLSAPVAVQITVFDRAHETLRLVERCTTDTPHASGETSEFTNTYWKSPNRTFFWRSEQWISNEIGYILLERVFE